MGVHGRLTQHAVQPLVPFPDKGECVVPKEGELKFCTHIHYSVLQPANVTLKQLDDKAYKDWLEAKRFLEGRPMSCFRMQKKLMCADNFRYCAGGRALLPCIGLCYRTGRECVAPEAGSYFEWGAQKEKWLIDGCRGYSKTVKQPEPFCTDATDTGLPDGDDEFEVDCPATDHSDVSSVNRDTTLAP